MATPEKKPKTKKDRFVTPLFITSFPHLDKPQGMPGAKEKFSVTMLISKDDDASPFTKAIRRAKIAKFGADESEWPEEIESPIKNGDSKKLKKLAGYPGHWAIKASSDENIPPGIYKVGKDGKAVSITDEKEIRKEFYPGAICDAIVFAYVWEFGSKTGVGFILDDIRKRKEGKKLAGKPDAVETFGVLEVEDDGEESDDDDDNDNELPEDDGDPGEADDDIADF